MKHLTAFSQIPNFVIDSPINANLKVILCYFYRSKDTFTHSIKHLSTVLVLDKKTIRKYVAICRTHNVLISAGTVNTTNGPCPIYKFQRQNVETLLEQLTLGINPQVDTTNLGKDYGTNYGTDLGNNSHLIILDKNTGNKNNNNTDNKETTLGINPQVDNQDYKKSVSSIQYCSSSVSLVNTTPIQVAAVKEEVVSSIQPACSSVSVKEVKKVSTGAHRSVFNDNLKKLKSSSVFNLPTPAEIYAANVEKLNSLSVPPPTKEKETIIKEERPMETIEDFDRVFGKIEQEQPFEQQ